MIIVSGAYGKLGRAVVDRLLDRIGPERIGVCVRDPGRAAGLRERGVRVRQGDFADAAGLVHAFEGASRVLVVSVDAHGAEAVLVSVGILSRGFRLADAHLQLYAETDVFEEERVAPEKRRNLAKTFLSDLRDLKVGDLVVHVDHGIGEFVGLKQLGVRGSEGGQEFLELRYHGRVDEMFEARRVLEVGAAGMAAERGFADRLAPMAEEVTGMFASLTDPQLAKATTAQGVSARYPPATSSGTIAACAEFAASNGAIAAAAAPDPASFVSFSMKPRLSSVRCVYSS